MAANKDDSASSANAYPPIADYALISDCHSMALVSRDGSIDWCCMPRVDSPSCFGRLLDWERGGYCQISPVDGDDEFRTHREYLADTMVLATTFSGGAGEARVLDCFAMRRGGREEPYRQLIRVVEGVRGKVDLLIRISPRFDYGEVKPWVRRSSLTVHTAVGGSTGLLVSTDFEVEMANGHDLLAQVTVRAEERVRLSIHFHRPEQLDSELAAAHSTASVDERLDDTITWWRRWAQKPQLDGPDGPSARRSALVLKALTNAPTGAMAAAATTSLPESVGGNRNWDYRFSWIRDSTFSVRSLADIGADSEADGFRRFIQRSAAGSAGDLQIMYGVGGERRLTEILLGKLDGYCGSRPVRIGNAASQQLQLDAYGQLVLLSWRWHQRGSSPDDDYWRFLLELVDTAAERWREPDRGIWEIRGEPKHFVYSKLMCWLALDRGVALAKECMRVAPVRRWNRTAKEIKEAVEERGYESKRGVFVQAFGSRNMDASLLLLPSTGFVKHDDERMIRTVDEVRRELEVNGLLLRYRTDRVDDGLEKQPEGHFLACSFWLAECLARQGRLEDARAVFDRVAGTSNDLGLFAEEYDTATGLMLGNFPQALTHLSHIAAAISLAQLQHLGHHRRA
jgi:GH15 family glucan-1,4-alpha-glucosidase